MSGVTQTAQAMGFNYRELIKRHKRGVVFLKPSELLDACAEYFEYCEATPILEENVWQYQGSIVRADKAKCRAFTKKGLCAFLGITESRFDGFRTRKGWKDAVELVDSIIYNQKFENAAAGLLNATLIARDLGLAEKQEIETGVTVNLNGDDARL